MIKANPRAAKEIKKLAKKGDRQLAKKLKAKKGK
mgnify:CR=1 FL=1